MLERKRLYQITKGISEQIMLYRRADQIMLYRRADQIMERRNQRSRGVDIAG